MLRRAFLLAAPLLAIAAPAYAENAVSIDIYAIPSQPVVDAMAKVSDSLAAQGMTTFYRQGHAVHATLYLTRYPVSAEPALKAAIRKLAKGRKAFPLTVGGLQVTPATGCSSAWTALPSFSGWPIW
ncbi:hypothetical protein [Novosphingobium sp. 9]|uniref:hypothetical protein n=1 Tax=Novosphingobium sp. 9 TaxID=2025349 RepID=UPI0021B60AA4|nr:hypothetical protein [Novosphingobium sp. 9]